MQTLSSAHSAAEANNTPPKQRGVNNDNTCQHLPSVSADSFLNSAQVGKSGGFVSNLFPGTCHLSTVLSSKWGSNYHIHIWQMLAHLTNVRQLTKPLTFSVSYPSTPRSGVLRAQKLKDPSVENPELKKCLLFKPGAGPYIATYATPTARTSSLLISTLPVHSPAFFQNLSRVFLCWLCLTPVPVWYRRKQKVTLFIITVNGCRFPCWVPAEYT